MASTSVELEQILQGCLDDIRAGRETLETALGERPTLSAQLRPDLEAATWIWQMSGVFDPRPGYISASRGRLVEQIQHEAQPSERRGWGSYSFFDLISSLRPNPAFWLRMVAVMVLVIFALWGTRGIAQASYTALPGDSLYRVKMGMEDATMALSFNPVSDANLHIEFARQRLLEMQMLTLEGRYDEIAPAAHRFEYHLDQALQVMNELPGRDPRNLKFLVNSMQDAVTRQTHFIDFLSESVPADTKLVFDRVTSVSNKGLSTANDLLTLNLGIPTKVSAAERFVSISIPSVVTDRIVTDAFTAPPMKSSGSDLSALFVSATAIQTASVIPLTGSTIVEPAHLTSEATRVPAFSHLPEISPASLVPAAATTALIDENDQPAKKPKLTKPQKPLKEPKPTRAPKVKDK